MKKMLLFCLLAGLAAEAFPQGSWMVPTMVPKNAIVRTVDASHTLIYNDGGSGNGSFLLYENGMPLQSFSLPSGSIVHDVEVYDNATAYFCGERGGKGMVGFFDVMPTFYGSAPVTYGFMPAMFVADSMDCNNCDMGVRRLKRLSVANVGGQVEMAMVAEGEISFVDGPAARTAVLSAFYNAGTWYVGIEYNKTGRVDFTDVDFVDDYLVAVGTGASGARCYVKTFERLPLCAMHPVVPSHDDEVACGAPVGPAFVVTKGGSRAAVVQYGDYPGLMVHYMEFNTLAGLPTLSAQSLMTASSAIPFASGTWELNEVRYSRANEMLYALGVMNHPAESGFGSWLMPVPDGSTGTVDPIRYLSGKQYSIDVNAMQHPVSVGVSASTAGVLSLRPELDIDEVEGDCLTDKALLVTHPASYLVEDWVDDESFVKTMPGRVRPVKVEEVEVVAECEK